MSPWRRVAFAAFLSLVATAGWPQGMSPAERALNEEASRPRPAAVSGLKVYESPAGTGIWRVEFDHQVPADAKQIKILQTVYRESAGKPEYSATIDPASPGNYHANYELQRPFQFFNFTREVTVSILAAGETALASQKVAASIDWLPAGVIAMNRMLASAPPEKLVEEQARRIDGRQPAALQGARSILEALVRKYPQTDSAYVELARIAINTNWGPEGWAAAERLLDSARQLRPDNPNMKILLGYVYAQQKRYKEAEALFINVAKVPQPNLWLWCNWGSLLDMQGRDAEADEKFKLAYAQPPKNDRYDGARRCALEHMLVRAQARHDFAAVEAVHKQRTSDYGLVNCYGAAYAEFLLYHKGEARAAADLALKTGHILCPEGTDVIPQGNETLGAAYYVLWMAAKEPERAELLRQARVQFPVGAKLFQRLASNDKMLETAKQLVASGEKVDQIDNARFTALAHALQEQEIDTARRLLRIGARPTALVGPGELPVALIPVFNRDFEGIKLMQGAGVDYRKVLFRGATALDQARDAGDKELLEALQGKSKGV